MPPLRQLTPQIGKSIVTRLCEGGAVDSGNGVRAGEAGFKAFSFESERPFNADCFEQFLAQVPFALFRIKGPVRYADKTVLLNYVGGQAAFKDWEGDQGSRLAFIGWGIEADEILPRLKSCLVGG